MKRIILFIFLLTVMTPFACKKKESANHLTPAQIQERIDAFKLASPLASSRKLIGTWKALAKDMPNGSKLVEWQRVFTLDSYVIESIVLSDMATGPVLFYKVKNSRLYTSVLPNKDLKEEGEIRIKNEVLFLKAGEDIYIFNRVHE